MRDTDIKKNTSMYKIFVKSITSFVQNLKKSFKQNKLKLKLKINHKPENFTFLPQDFRKIFGFWCIIKKMGSSIKLLIILYTYIFSVFKCR